VLITGATGLIGTELTKSLRSKNITVRRLTTGAKKDENDFSWDPASNSIGTSLEEISLFDSTMPLISIYCNNNRFRIVRKILQICDHDRVYQK
jgi:NAD dependent epimerase/dehydratase family enzyme